MLRSLADTRLEPVSWAWLGISYVRWMWILSALGIAIRLEQYLHNRSLWLDESLMALNLLHRSFGALTKPLDYQLVAPILWLFAEKSCNLLFGSSELALRLVAVVSGTLAMVMVGVLAKRLVPPRAAVVAVALFALSPPLIYYSSELKPYGSDAAACALLWLVGFWSLRGSRSILKLAVLALTGAAVLWFSHPALFVACGFGVAVIWSCMAQRDWRRLSSFVPVFLAWAASFALDYWFTLYTSSRNVQLPLAYPFFTFPIRFSSIENVIESVFVLQQGPVTLLLGVVLFAAVIGGLYFWREDRSAFLFLVSPLLLALIASNRHLYPVVGRFYMFYTPALFLLAGAGAEEICAAARSRSLPVAPALFVLLFFQPILSTADVAVHHQNGEEMRSVLEYVQHHQHPRDAWYIYHYGRTSYQYYAEAYGLTGSKVVIGTGFRTPVPHQPFRMNWDVYREDFSKLRGDRVWVIFAHAWAGDGVDEMAYAVHTLDSMGVKLDSHFEIGAAAYLYDLSRPPTIVHALSNNAPGELK